ncbi:hypothetical protein DNTS_025926 [Danionella cerebrum]|uniref:Ras-associating domain-containing protein n=1 Tax=Danionella cerebrum TaxID=2873325 RepID=A0A553MWY8_9TELE|nr:hypothetical protein DNTS_025926 [Danionella translucida]
MLKSDLDSLDCFACCLCNNQPLTRFSVHLLCRVYDLDMDTVDPEKVEVGENNFVTKDNESIQTSVSIAITDVDGQLKDSGELQRESTHSDRLSRTRSDVSGKKISGRRLGIRRVKRHRCSFNGHFYNHKTAVFTPSFGSVTNVRINSCMTTSQVIRVLLNKFKIENSPEEFSLYLVHTSGERHQLKPGDHPLVVRVLQGPCEQVSKLFLMETNQMEEVTYDVAQYIKFELPVLQSFVAKLQEEEEREMQKLKRRYAESRSIIKSRRLVSMLAQRKLLLLWVWMLLLASLSPCVLCKRGFGGRGKVGTSKGGGLPAKAPPSQSKGSRNGLKLAGAAAAGAIGGAAIGYGLGSLGRPRYGHGYGYGYDGYSEEDRRYYHQNQSDWRYYSNTGKSQHMGYALLTLGAVAQVILWV